MPCGAVLVNCVRGALLYTEALRQWNGAPIPYAQGVSDIVWMGTIARMTVIRSASGTRIDCDNCGEHTASPELSAPQLRAATGYVRPAGQGSDFCPRCAKELFGVESSAGGVDE